MRLPRTYVSKFTQLKFDGLKRARVDQSFLPCEPVRHGEAVPKAEVGRSADCSRPPLLRRGLGLVAERRGRGEPAAPARARRGDGDNCDRLNFTLSSRTRPASPGPLAPPHGAMTIAERTERIVSYETMIEPDKRGDTAWRLVPGRWRKERKMASSTLRSSPTIRPARCRDGQQVYWETCGTRRQAAVMVHGGPGRASRRGCGRCSIRIATEPCCSTSAAAGEAPARQRSRHGPAHNTTDHLVSDMERLREQLGIDRWLLTVARGNHLALVYASDTRIGVADHAQRHHHDAAGDRLALPRRRPVLPEQWERFAPEPGPGHVVARTRG